MLWGHDYWVRVQCRGYTVRGYGGSACTSKTGRSDADLKCAGSNHGYVIHIELGRKAVLQLSGEVVDSHHTIPIVGVAVVRKQYKRNAKEYAQLHWIMAPAR